MAVTIPQRKGVKKDWPIIGIVNPGKGLNNVISDEYIDNNEASDLRNIMYVEAGNPAKRYGHTTVGTGLSNNPKGLASYYPTVSGVIQRYLLTIDGTALKYLNGTAWTLVSGATFTTGKNTNFTQAKGNLYILNGTDSARQLTSALTLTSPTTIPTGSFSIYYNSRHMMAGVASQPSRLYISNLNDMSDFTVATGQTGGGVGGSLPDNVTDVPGTSIYAGTAGVAEANFIDVAKDDGDKITGLAKFQNQLVIFKERTTYSLTYDTNGNPVIQQVSTSVGCVSHRSIDNVENDVFFLSRNGYYVLGNQPNYFNVLRTNELSAKIHPVIETITAANLPTCASIFSGYVFYSSIAVGGTTTNNRTLTFDRRYGAWSVWDSTNANAFSEFIDSNNVKHLYYASDDEAQVYEIMPTYTDNNVAISSYWTSKALNMGDFSLAKKILYVDVEFRVLAGTVTVEVITDGNTTSKSSSLSSAATDTVGTWGDELWGIPMWGGSNGTVTTSTLSGQATANTPYRIAVGKDSRTVKLKISNANANETFVFLGFKVYYRPYNVQKFPSSQKLL